MQLASAGPAIRLRWHSLLAVGGLSGCASEESI